jgi:hypothetical protein
MKLKTTIFLMTVCLLCFSFSASAQQAPACTGNGQDNDYHYTITQDGDKTYLTFHSDNPAAGTSGTRLFFYGPDATGGYPANNFVSGVAQELTGLPANGTRVYFYFVYSFAPGEKNNAGNRHSFIVGDCSGSSTPNVKPEVTLLPAIGGPFISPASVLLRASATDEDGTITKVEFYNGAVKIGETTDGNLNVYSLQWENVQPGTHTITAKATDDKLGTTTSNHLTVTVTGDFTQEWCGESAGAAVPTTGNEFQWRAETASNGDVIVTFRGIGAAAGSDFAILTGYGEMNYSATTGNHTSVITDLAQNSPLSLSFVYRRGTATNNIGENNSNANPVTYTVGSLCAMPTLPVSLIDFNSKAQPDGSVSLNWATASENNNNYFLLERSADGKNFNELTTVYSKDGNSTSRLDYQFTDENPVIGNNYYKLSQFDNDGKSQELGLRVERGLLITQSSSIYPNPLKGSAFNVVLNQQINGLVSVRVSNLSGLEIYRNDVQASSGNLKVELPFKPANGIYLVKAGENQTFKLLVE